MYSISSENAVTQKNVSLQCKKYKKKKNVKEENTFLPTIDNNNCTERFMVDVSAVGSSNNK